MKEHKQNKNAKIYTSNDKNGNQGNNFECLT